MIMFDKIMSILYWEKPKYGIFIRLLLIISESLNLMHRFK